MPLESMFVSLTPPKDLLAHSPHQPVLVNSMIQYPAGKSVLLTQLLKVDMRYIISHICLSGLDEPEAAALLGEYLSERLGERVSVDPIHIAGYFHIDTG